MPETIEPMQTLTPKLKEALGRSRALFVGAPCVYGKTAAARALWQRQGLRRAPGPGC